MEENTPNQQENISNQDLTKPKIVNLFEDMNHHEHDEKSYEKMASLNSDKDSKDSE